MFRNKPAFTTDYRSYRIEVRLMHHPQGVITDLKIFGLNDSVPEFSLRNLEFFADSADAAKAMTAIAFGFVDSVMLKTHSGKRSSFE